MGQDVKNSSRVCPLPPGLLKRRPRLLGPRTMVLSLTFILTSTVLISFMMPGPIPQPPPPPPPVTPHGAIAIVGDKTFSTLAMLKGWPGDGSPENPYVIDGLDIDLSGARGPGIRISNTRISFTISNCNLTGANSSFWDRGMGAGIYLENVTNGKLVNNTCFSNDIGIWLRNSTSNTVVNNTCSNKEIGIWFLDSNSNTVADNTCFSNDIGIWLRNSKSNTVTNNTCFSNGKWGIYLGYSDSNTVVNNTCTNNIVGVLLWRLNHNIVVNNTCDSNDSAGIQIFESDSNMVAGNTCDGNRIGIWLYDSHQNTVVHNTLQKNAEHDILEEFVTEEFVTEEFEAEEFDPTLLLFVGFMGFIVITLLGGLIVGNRLSKGE